MGSADAESSGGESGYPNTQMPRDFPDAIHVRPRSEELWTAQVHIRLKYAG
jgi:hypothetical protein